MLKNKLPFFLNYINSGTLETVNGFGSITLNNAKANSLQYLKLFGGCEQSGTPTPTR